MNAAPVIQMHCCKILFCDITSLFEDIKVDEKKKRCPKTSSKRNKERRKEIPRQTQILSTVVTVTILFREGQNNQVVHVVTGESNVSVMLDFQHHVNILLI